MKVGDRVRVLVDDPNFNRNEIYTVSNTDSSDIYNTELNNIKWFESKELELIESCRPTTPKRYATDSIDVIDFCKLYNLNFSMGNIVKYVCRDKGTDIEDLEKVIDYAKREIKYLKDGEKRNGIKFKDVGRNHVN